MSGAWGPPVSKRRPSARREATTAQMDRAVRRPPWRPQVRGLRPRSAAWMRQIAPLGGRAGWGRPKTGRRSRSWRAPVACCGRLTPYDVLRAGPVAEGIAQLLHGNTAGFPVGEEYASLLSVARRCWGPLATGAARAASGGSSRWTAAAAGRIPPSALPQAAVRSVQSRREPSPRLGPGDQRTRWVRGRWEQIRQRRLEGLVQNQEGESG